MHQTDSICVCDKRVPVYLSKIACNDVERHRYLVIIKTKIIDIVIVDSGWKIVKCMVTVKNKGS